MQSDAHKRAVVDKLKEELRKDRLKTSAVSMTGLGLVELTRKRTRLSADTFMLDECEHCAGGYVMSATHLALKLRDDMIDHSMAHECPSMIVRVNPVIMEHMFRFRILAREVAGIWKGKRVYLIPDPTLPRDGAVIEGSSEKVLTLPPEARLAY